MRDYMPIIEEFTDTDVQTLAALLDDPAALDRWRRFPSRAAIARMFAEAGFSDCSDPVVERIRDDCRNEEILSSYFFEKKSCSQLILLSNDAYARGVARVRREISIARGEGREAVFRTDIRTRMFHALKSSS